MKLRLFFRSKSKYLHRLSKQVPQIGKWIFQNLKAKALVHLRQNQAISLYPLSRYSARLMLHKWQYLVALNNKIQSDLLHRW